MNLIYRGITYECHPSKASGRPFQQIREPGVAGVGCLVANVEGVSH
ncbi:MAG: hypothetical protein HC862_06285 [Scytonema sp. RU_4_4]|nr:hypothetical protein [Scytonema sp. RU_4_4]NJR73399.1 hypothetical protein [Scytonema sp. CRU_2_7]